VLAGAFDSIYGIGAATPVRRRNQMTRRDLLLAVADLQRSAQADARAASRARGLRRSSLPAVTEATGPLTAAADPGGPARSDPRGGAPTRDRSRRFGDRREIPGRDVVRAEIPGVASPAPPGRGDPRDLARAQSAATEPVRPQEIQLAFDFESDGGDELVPSGLPEMSDAERVRAELSILGLDASRHMVDFYLPLMKELGVVFSADLLSARSRSELLIGGVKVATQTPPIRSGRRVVFLTLDDTTGLADATFFEDAQGPYAATLFSSWTLLVRGELRRTGPRGVSVRATGCWDLNALFSCWRTTLDQTGDPVRSLDAVHDLMAQVPVGFGERAIGLSSESERTGSGAGQSAAGQADPTGQPPPHESDGDAQQHTRGGGMGRRRVLVHPSGFRQSPYADIAPSGIPVTSTRTADALPASMSGVAPPPGPADLSDGGAADAPRKLWHSSQGSSGR
jgi:error-prone DNA polymerase